MYNVIIAEFIKLKRSRIVWLIPLCVIIHVLMALLALDDMYNYNSSAHTWMWLFDTVAVFMTYFSTGTLAIVTGFVFTREYQENTMNVLFTYPFSRLKFYFSKMIVIFTMTVVLFACSIILALLSGFLFGYDYFSAGSLLIFIRCSIFSALLEFLLVPLAAFVAISGKNIFPVAVLGIVHAVLIGLISNPKYNSFVPGCIPPLIISRKASALGGYLLFSGNVDRACIILVATSVAFALAGLFYYKNMDVA